MKKRWLATVFTAAFLVGQAYGTSVTSVNVVGYMNLSVAEGGASAPSYTFMSIPMTRTPAARGTITANTATTITDDSADWAAGSFSAGDETHYVEIVDGATHNGRYFYITSHTEDTLTFADPGDLEAGDLDGLRYKIVPATRVKDVFGSPGNALLKTGSTAANADTVAIWNGTGWNAPIYYYINPQQGQFGGIFDSPNHDHWVQGTQIADNYVIDRDAGFVVKRSAGESGVDLVAVGEVSGNDQAITLATGYELVGGMSAVDEVISLSNLKDVLQSGSTAANADTITAWTGTGWGPPVYYYINPQQGQFGGIFDSPNHDHWVQGTSIVDDTFKIEAGRAYMIKKLSPTDVWVRNSPLAE